MKPKLLIICGPTAVGKTDLGIELAQKYNGEIVSADSRQVYKGMDVGTGKDIDKNAKFQIANFKYKNWNNEIEIGYREKESIPIWLVDVVSPNYQFNVADFKRVATLVISDIHSRGKLPIVVGGTGLYIKSLLSKIDTIGVPQDNRLRKLLEEKSVEQLQQMLKDKDIERFERMNHSDAHNPRRLVRAIEIACHNNSTDNENSNECPYDSLLIGLKVDAADLNTRISQRVEGRVSQGLEQEVRDLVKLGYRWDLPSMSATGYRAWQDYFDGKIQRPDVITKIKREEIQYAKRQLTWFAQMQNIMWFDLADSDWKEMLMEKISKWYTNS